jgi:hypothetical protein
MKKLFLAFTALLATYSATGQLIIEDVTVEKNLTVSGQELTLNGAGVRTKAFFDLYVGALYTTAKTTDGNKLIKEDKPMAITLDITSRLVSQSTMIDAVENGFEDSCTKKERTAIKSEIEKFIGFFNEEIVLDDHFEIAYLPGKGTVVSKNGKVKGTIAGLAFKKGLFGIWLGNEPADEDLKELMLNQ